MVEWSERDGGLIVYNTVEVQWQRLGGIYGGTQVSCQHFSFEFDKPFFMQQNSIFGTPIIILWHN